MLPVNVLVEGETDHEVVKRILEHVGLPYGEPLSLPWRGRGHVLGSLRKYNQAAQRDFPCLVIVDLDQKPDCAPELIRDVLPNPAKDMCFRVAVRGIEAWLLADREHLAAYLDVPLGKFPKNPDLEVDPKITMVNLARLSKKESIRKDMVLPEGRIGKEADRYGWRLRKFVHDDTHPWRPEIAAQCSDSLWRCIEALKNLGNLE